MPKPHQKSNQKQHGRSAAGPQKMQNEEPLLKEEISSWFSCTSKLCRLTHQCAAMEKVRNISPSPLGSQQTQAKDPAPLTEQAMPQTRKRSKPSTLADRTQSEPTPLSSSPALDQEFVIQPHPNPLRNIAVIEGLPLLQPSPQVAVAWRLPGPTPGM